RAELERGDARGGAERVGVEGPGVGHALAPVPVGIPAEGEHTHELALAAKGAAREPTGHDLRERGEIGRHAEIGLGPAGRVAEARDHLVEDEDDPVARRQRPELLEVARDRRCGPRLATRGLEDDGGAVAARRALLHALGPSDLELVAGAHVGGPRHLLLHRPDDGRVAVAEEERAVAHPVIHVLVAIDVPLAGALGTLDVDRERRQVADVVRDPARNRRAGTLPERRRLRMLGTVLVVDFHVGMIPERAAHRSSSTTAAWASMGNPSTVASRRRVTPSEAPAATHASTRCRSSAGVWRRSRSARRESAATTPYPPQFDTPATTR